MKSIPALDASLKSSLSLAQPVFWLNPNKMKTQEALSSLASKALPTLSDIQSADERLRRFAPLLAQLFPETQASNGIIESKMKRVEQLQLGIIPFIGGRIIGDWWTKLDSHLDIAGSIKARGGVYEVLMLAEKLATEHGLVDSDQDYTQFAQASFKALFNQYTILVGSTGNLGLSIGIISRAIGFNVTVHMSSDAKPWKISLLKEKGATVVLHDSDYSKAVEEGRTAALNDPFAYFIDDENSVHLFTGYAVAALRLKTQLADEGITVDDEHPLFVYLPCGVGGAPGGVAYGLKLIFEDSVKIFFAEPTHAPCMLLGMASGLHSKIAVEDIGIELKTEADGLAVGRPSGFVGEIMMPLIDGIFTVEDHTMLWLLHLLSVTDKIELEPSALAGFYGPIQLFYTKDGFNYLLNEGLLEKMQNATHLSWATGGGLVPKAIMDDFKKAGASVKIEF